MKLGVNIDHIATLREARKINDPDPLEAIYILKNAGAHQVTLHLREDRRHINEYDLKRVIENAPIPVNVECAVDEEVVSIIAALRPHRVTLVPEKREEVTTEGGLELEKNRSRLQSVTETFKSKEVSVNLFIDPSLKSIEHSLAIGADAVELHTGHYANLHLALFSNINHTTHKLFPKTSRKELGEKFETAIADIQECAKTAKSRGLFVAAGHGLNYHNLDAILRIKEIEELNIGHSIISRSVFTGLECAIKDMLELMS